MISIIESVEAAMGAFCVNYIVKGADQQSIIDALWGRKAFVSEGFGSTPQAGHWGGKEAISEGDDRGSVVKHCSEPQIVTTDV